MSESHNFAGECAVTYFGGKDAGTPFRRIVVRLGDRAVTITARHNTETGVTTEVDISAQRADPDKEWIKMGGAKFR